MSPEQASTREQLAALLWGSCTDQQARQSLRQALALLRKELRWPHFLSTDTEVVRLQPGCWSIDAREFEALSKSHEPTELDRAARLFGGDFLSGLNIEEEGFEEWLREQRQRIQLAAARLCETFVARPDLVIDGTAGARRRRAAAARIDPLREDWQRIALTLYARYRGKSEALAQAELFADVLQRELDVGPERETQDLVERIRAGEIAVASAPTPPARHDEPAAEAGLAPAAQPRSGALARHCGGARGRRARGRRNVRADPPARTCRRTRLRGGVRPAAARARGRLALAVTRRRDAARPDAQEHRADRDPAVHRCRRHERIGAADRRHDDRRSDQRACRASRRSA